MLADRGDNRPMKDMVKTMSFFCVCVYVEKGGPGSILASAVSIAFSISTFEVLVVVSLLGCVSIMVEDRVVLGCWMIVFDCYVDTPFFCIELWL
jgi:hypothetical protein